MMPLVGLTGACCAFPSWLHTERSALTRLRKAWASRRAVAGATDTVSSIATNAQCGVAGRLTRGVPLDRMGRGCTRPHATSYVVLRAGLRAVAHLSARLTSSFLREYRARALITCAYAVLAVYCCGAGSRADCECERDQREEGGKEADRRRMRSASRFRGSPDPRVGCSGNCALIRYLAGGVRAAVLFFVSVHTQSEINSKPKCNDRAGTQMRRRRLPLSAKPVNSNARVPREPHCMPPLHRVVYQRV